MRRKKGFTLVEVLAVIVILAIIALIATPLVLNIVKKAQRGAFLRSVDNVIKAGELFYLDAEIQGIKGDTRFECTNNKCTSDKIDRFGKTISLEVQGEMGEGYVIVTSDGNIELALEKNKYCATKYRYSEEVNIIQGTCDGIDLVSDNTNPIIKNISTQKGANSIKVVVTAEDPESGISYYEYSIDNGLSYTEKTRNNIYTFTSLEPGTYQIRVRVYNGTVETNSYNSQTGMSESGTYEVVLEEIVTTTCITPTIESVTPTNWSESKAVTVNYGENCEGEYSLDNSSSWNSGNEVTVTENQTIIFKNEVETFSYQVTGIKPVITLGEVEIKATSITIPYTINVDDANEPTCEYGIDESYGTLGTIENGTCVIEDLDPETEYFYKISVTQKDKSGTDEVTGSDETLEEIITIESAPSGKEGLIAVAYYNPTTGLSCTKSQYNTNLNNHTSDGVHTTPTELNSGCMKWYVFKDNGNGTVDMILDHNTVARVEFSRTTSPYLTNTQMINELEIILANSTSNWSNTITARLITGDEIATITVMKTWDNTSTSSWWFETKTSSKPDQYTGAYSWLYDYTFYCTSYGCDIVDNNNYPATKTTGVTTGTAVMQGYWTGTPRANNSTDVWEVQSGGLLISRDFSSNAFGLRPVITVSKTTLGL